MPSHFVAWTEIAQRHGLHFPEARFYSLGGVPTAKIAAMLIAEAGLTLDPLGIALEKEQMYYESLAAANKRVANILRQATEKGETFAKVDRKELKEAAEISLFDALQKAAGSADQLFERGDYAGYLRTFAVLKAPVDAFFDKVMVMVEQKALRQNRLALLADLRKAMNRVADISKLAV